MKNTPHPLKSIFILTLTAILLITAPPFKSEAAEARIVLYLNPPAEWNAPSVWAWNEDGKNAFDAWPGGEMEADPGNEGWYYCYLPDWANHVIVNANDGTVQTEELILEGKNTWVTVAADNSAEISYDAMTKGEAPEYVETFKVHASVPESWQNVNLWAWSAPEGKNAFEAWPGKPMKKGEDGSYTAFAPVWINSLIINGNDGEVQTEDISVDAAEIWITVAEDNTYDYSYDDPAKAAAPDITVSVKVPDDWSAPCLWAWSAPDGTNAFSAWPGEPLEESQDGWMKKTVPGWINSVIVNAKEGSVQTTDLSVETGKDLWITVNSPEDAAVSYEQPKEDNSATESEAPAAEETEPAEEAAPGQEAVSTANNEAEGGGLNPVLLAGIAALVLIGGGAVVYKVKKK